MFPDSAIAKKYSCGRTKATALIQHMASVSTSNIVSEVKKNPFSLSTDGSNDAQANKLYPITITYFDEKIGKNSTVLLSLVESSNNTGEGIFNVLNNEFVKKNISWSNCVSFSCDNANTIIGQVKGVVSHIKKVQPAIIVQRCSCHLVNLAAQKSATQLKGFNVEQFLIQLYFFLEKSSKRKHNLKLSQAVCGTKPHKILKHVNTRWLSLLESIDRILEQWEALEHYFSDNEEANSQYKNLASMIGNPSSKLYCLFLSATLPLFTSVNVFLQQEAPLVHVLKRKLHSLLSELLVRFIKPSAFDVTATSLADGNFERRRNQKENCDLVIGSKARSYIGTTADLSEDTVATFYSEVREFYKAGCNYILRKFPLNDEFLSHAEIADVALRQSVSFASVQYMCSLFPVLKPEESDKVESEFAHYQFENFNCAVTSGRMDEVWHRISLMKNESGQLKYESLSKIMKMILIVPHSNASTERIFSIVKKKT